MEEYRGYEIDVVEGDETVDTNPTYYRPSAIASVTVKSKMHFAVVSTNEMTMEEAHEQAVRIVQKKVDWMLDSLFPRNRKFKRKQQEKEQMPVPKPKRKRKRKRKTQK